MLTRALASALIVAVAFAAIPAKLGAQSKSAPPKKNTPKATSADTERQRELKTQQQDLQAELGRLKRQLAASEKSQIEAADALAESERAISVANRRLRELARTRGQVEAQIAGLQTKSRSVAARESDAQRQLDELLRQQHELSLRDPFHLLLEGESPARLSRDSEYLGYIGRASAETLSRLQERRAELQELETQSRSKRDELARIEAEETESRKDLQKEQARRSRTLDTVGKQIAVQRTSIAKLERDEKRLGTLVDQLGKVIAEQARREAERARLAAAKKATPPSPTKSTPPPAAVAPSPAPIAPSQDTERPSFTGNFALLKGKMILPAAGPIDARFGSQRRGEAGVNAPTWKGIFIRASAGAEVRAVGPGRVVFADWLRGFGNLLIVDHGDGYLSVYGNNEALLRNAGDEVAVGETIASVGNTGGNEHPGLYFELRFRGRPFDPLTWTASR